MLRFLGAPALALTMLTTTAPDALATQRQHHAAPAAHRHHHTAHATRHYRVAHVGYRRYRSARGHVSYRRYAVVHARGHGARPRAWCGWYARSMVGQDPGPNFNLARNWARWGRPSRPGVGVMVVWPHHVGLITGQTADGQWIVKSGNDGRAVRERARSLAGAIAFRSS